MTALTASDLFGVWTLERYELIRPDGRIVQPMGEAPLGQLIYTADGHMSAQLSPRGRAPFHGKYLLGGSAAEKVAAIDSYLAYGGTWRVRGAEVVHRVEISLFPNWVGDDQVRLADWDGGRLVLTTPPMPRAEGSIAARLTWRRA
jgi:hypothetical protein